MPMNLIIRAALTNIITYQDAQDIDAVLPTTKHTCQLGVGTVVTCSRGFTSELHLIVRPRHLAPSSTPGTTSSTGTPHGAPAPYNGNSTVKHGSASTHQHTIRWSPVQAQTRARPH